MMVRRILKRLAPAAMWRDDRGQDFTEYALIVAFMVSVLAAVNQNVATHVVEVLLRVNAVLTAAAAGSSSNYVAGG